MTLVEHLLELRSRLFKASLALVAGMIVGVIIAGPVLDFLTDPYCSEYGTSDGCGFVASSPVDYWLLKLKIGLYVGMILSSPVWLYQLWSFITPGLHRNEKRWAYSFVAVAVPLFFAGAVLAHFVVAKGLQFLLPAADSKYDLDLGIVGYIDFVTGMLLIFGVAFEFPLIVFMLNLAGVVSARRLLGWWRTAVFLIFVFTAIVTPTPDPFGMTALALPMCALYFAAVGASFLNERRRERARLATEHEALHDDEASPLDYRVDPVEPPAPVEAPSSVEPPAPVDGPDRDRP
jgi:sec-independent protein translocase protein TatC